MPMNGADGVQDLSEVIVPGGGGAQQPVVGGGAALAQGQLGRVRVLAAGVRLNQGQDTRLGCSNLDISIRRGPALCDIQYTSMSKCQNWIILQA